MAGMLTKAGHEKLLAEHAELSRVERPRVVQGVADAAAEGDRSENAEYIYGKKRLREIDKRLQYLGRLLRDVVVVDPQTLSGDTVQFGATVSIVTYDPEDDDDEGVHRTWTIVGGGEAETKEGSISVDAPLAKALLGKRVGDIVTVNRPKGEVDVEILGLAFGRKP